MDISPPEVLGTRRAEDKGCFGTMPGTRNIKYKDPLFKSEFFDRGNTDPPGGVETKAPLIMLHEKSRCLFGNRCDA